MQHYIKLHAGEKSNIKTKCIRLQAAAKDIVTELDQEFSNKDVIDKSTNDIRQAMYQLNQLLQQDE